MLVRTFLKNNKYRIALSGIVTLAAFLRLYHLMGSGFKLTDEGYHFYPSIDLYNAFERGTTQFLTWYHGLEFWIAFGCSFFGFTYDGALLWAAVCGIISVPLLYIFSSCVFSRKTALFCALALAFNYYLVFYARTALATGYAVFFFCWFLIVLNNAARLTKILPEAKDKPVSRTRRILAILATGVFLGMLTHIRIELGFIGLGMVGALGLTVLIENSAAGFERGRKAVWKAWKPLFIIVIIAVCVYLLFFLILDSVNWIDWKNSLVFYKGHLGFAAGSDHPWGPYFLTDIWYLSGIPFLFISLWGLVSETVSFKRLSLERKWFVIAFWGMSVFLFKTGLAYPRTYVYTVLFLCVYWGVGIRRISVSLRSIRLSRVFRTYATLLLIALSFAGEFRLINPLFHKKSRYDEAEKFIAARGTGNIHCTHSWPIFELLPFKYKRYIIYDTYNRIANYKAFCRVLKNAYEKGNVKYMLLDNNLTYWGNDITMIQQFAATILPTAVFRNDYGDDWHTCMDAFGRPPVRNMFTNRIMVYDMKYLSKIPKEPIPFLGSKRMDEIFTERWNEKESEETTADMGKNSHKESK